MEDGSMETGAPISYDEKVEELIQGFDFDLVNRVMEYLGWIYETSNGVPSVEDLKTEARTLLEKLKLKPGVLGCGGIRASHREDGTLSLKFILTEYWSPICEEEDGEYSIV